MCYHTKVLPYRSPDIMNVSSLNMTGVTLEVAGPDSNSSTLNTRGNNFSLHQCLLQLICKSALHVPILHISIYLASFILHTINIFSFPDRLVFALLF